MSVIDTNVSFALGVNNIRLNGLSSQQSLQRLSTGLKVNYASDDPSGHSISKGMEAQIRGIRSAIQNTEDTINFIQTADSALHETHDILLRMRDIAVRAANEAVLATPDGITYPDGTRMQNEFTSLADELTRKASAVTFNTKKMLDGSLFAPGEVGQIGPDDGAQFRALIANLIGTDAAGLAVDGAAGAFVFVHTPLEARSAITAVNDAIETVSTMRSDLGIIQKQLTHTIQDMLSQDVNISAAKSRISDVNMASEIVGLTKLQILQQSSTTVLAQANAQPTFMLRLLD